MKRMIPETGRGREKEEGKEKGKGRRIWRWTEKRARHVRDLPPGLPGRIGGFAILEALIATVLLVAGLFAVLSFLNSATRVAADARIRTVATTLAEAGLQALQGYPEITDSVPGSGGNDCEDIASETVNAVFTRCWWVDDSRAVLPVTDPASSCTDGGYGAEPVCWVSVRVEVSWLDGAAGQQQVSLTSMLNAVPPERSGLDLMRLVTAVEQPGSSPQWLLASAVVEEDPDDDSPDLAEAGAGDDLPAAPDDDGSPTAACLPWDPDEPNGEEADVWGPDIGGEDEC